MHPQIVGTLFHPLSQIMSLHQMWHTGTWQTPLSAGSKKKFTRRHELKFSSLVGTLPRGAGCAALHASKLVFAGSFSLSFLLTVSVGGLGSSSAHRPPKRQQIDRSRVMHLSSCSSSAPPKLLSNHPRKASKYPNSRGLRSAHVFWPPNRDLPMSHR